MDLYIYLLEKGNKGGEGRGESGAVAEAVYQQQTSAYCKVGGSKQLFIID